MARRPALSHRFLGHALAAIGTLWGTHLVGQSVRKTPETWSAFMAAWKNSAVPFDISRCGWDSFPKRLWRSSPMHRNVLNLHAWSTYRSGFRNHFFWSFSSRTGGESSVKSVLLVKHPVIHTRTVRGCSLVDLTNSSILFHAVLWTWPKLCPSLKARKSTVVVWRFCESHIIKQRMTSCRRITQLR